MHLSSKFIITIRLQYTEYYLSRNRGWHGKSGLANTCGHVTVNFEYIRCGIYVHITTHHVYLMDEAYEEYDSKGN